MRARLKRPFRRLVVKFGVDCLKGTPPFNLGQRELTEHTHDLFGDGSDLGIRLERKFASARR